eukprot:2632597-Ditylum_brightwellii.AAC.1
MKGQITFPMHIIPCNGMENASLDGNSIKIEEEHTDIVVMLSKTKENKQTKRSSFREYGSKSFKHKEQWLIRTEKTLISFNTTGQC